MDKKKKLSDIKYGSWEVGQYDPERVAQVVSLVGKGKKVLDVGCGVGDIGQLLLENNNRVYGLDISPTAVKKARQKGIEAVCCDIEAKLWPFENRYFDVVVAAEIIEHIFDTDRFLDIIFSKLKKNGFLVLTTPNLATLGRRLLLVVGKDPLTEVRFDKNSAGHIRYFVKNSLEYLLKEHSFKITHFSSDLVNLTSSGRYRSIWLAHLLPSFGRSLIVKAVKDE